MRKLHIDGKSFQLPASMNEMNNEQLICLSKLVALSLPIQEVKVKMLFCCLRATARKMKNPGYFRIRIAGTTYALTVEQVADSASAFDYLFTAPDEKGNCFLDNRLTRNPFPEVKIRHKKYFGPKDNMTDMLYDQYVYLQTYDVMKEKRPDAIYPWLGCMLRKDKKSFNSDDLNIERMKCLKPEIVVLLIWFWIGSCRYISDRFPRIFSADGDGGSGNPYDGQQRLLDYMAKADPEKKRMYKKDLLYNILFSLDYMLEKEESEK